MVRCASHATGCYCFKENAAATAATASSAETSAARRYARYSFRRKRHRRPTRAKSFPYSSTTVAVPFPFASAVIHYLHAHLLISKSAWLDAHTAMRFPCVRLPVLYGAAVANLREFEPAVCTCTQPWISTSITSTR